MKQIQSRSLVRLLGILLLFGFLCCAFASAIWAETDSNGSDEASTPPQQDEGNGGDDPPGDTDGDPDEDRLTIQDISLELLLFLKRLGISM
jgi:hypothetical protein